MACVRAALFIGVISGGLMGCSALNAPESPRYTLEVETVEDQALSAVMSSSLEFTVELAAADDAWARARLFLSQYAASSAVPRAIAPRVSVLSSADSKAEPYLYKVTRAASPNGYHFRVGCEPRAADGSAAKAEQNARNLARFIREGTLELSLLNR